MTRPPERFAAIDVGSNSIRCLVAERGSDGHLQIIDDLKDYPRLGRGLAATGRLAPEAITESVAVIGRMLQAAAHRGVSRTALVATAAVREARNGRELCRRVREAYGVPLRVVDGKTEARLAFLSVREHFAIHRGRAIVVDIGGGSLEVVLATEGLVEHVASLPFGAVRATEAFLGPDTKPRAGVTALRAALRRELRRAIPAREWAGARLFGSGGTFTNAGRMLAARTKGVIPPGGVHGTVIEAGELERLLQSVLLVPEAERRTLPGVSPERADIIVAGLAVASEVLAHCRVRAATVSAFGLREGLLLKMSRPASRRAPPKGPEAMRRFAERCRGDLGHLEQVARLVRMLFDRLGPRLGCTPADWPLLEAAALLHDVGQMVSYRGHHKHSYHLIVHAEELPLSPEERELVGQVSRYHRKALPTKRHAPFAALGAEDRRRVRRLAALLRVADGLDRGHVAAVDRLRVRLTDARLHIGVVPRAGVSTLELEVWSGGRKADLLADLFGVEAVVEAAPRRAE